MNNDFQPHASPTMHAFAPGHCGTADWWEQVIGEGIPRIAPTADGQCEVTLLWRDPHGTELQSPTQRVVVDMNSVTDHHRPEPESMVRVPGTDVWYWQVTLPATWRGSYGFIPLPLEAMPPDYLGDDDARRHQQRQWWISIQQHAIADPFNPVRAGASLSALHLPGAPDQSCWQALERGLAGPSNPDQLRELPWYSPLLGNQRTVWLFEQGQPDASRPLVLLLDGQRWARQMPIWRALECETAHGRLPPAVYVLVDAIDGNHREAELGCNPLFWQAIQSELLPRIRDLIPCSRDRNRTLVAGQSLGGLAALYAGWHWPEHFGRVLSQSGSFWWPHVELLFFPSGMPAQRRPGASGDLAQEIAAAPHTRQPLLALLEVGSREDVMIDCNEAVRDALLVNGHHVQWQVFEGGHDNLCWRGGLIDGLARLLDHCFPLSKPSRSRQ
ncbi:enterochelin esterase [Chitiniphilus eburneus]|uniref:enterochelin esterase n=1 Tax=Chitiniphilus eburneus TaxID=2571148 RepID=UPI0035D071C8